MDKQLGNFKYSIRPYKDEDNNVFQFIVMSLQDPYFNQWQVEAMDLEPTESKAIAVAEKVMELLISREMLVEE